jgi:benzoate-CoA ligase family protein
MPRFNLADHFLDRHLREGRGEKIAMRCEDRSATYAQIAEQANRVGNGLRALGVARSERVILLLPDIPEFAACYFGAIKIGAVAVPTNTALRASDYAYLLNESQAAALIVHSSIYPRFDPALSGYPRRVVVCGDRDWDAWLAAQSPHLEPEETEDTDPAFWLWTSGSTGTPKAAVHLQRDWVSSCENYARGVLAIHADDVTFSSSKLFHAYGLGNGLMFPFYAGASSVLFPGRPQAAAILATAQAARPTLFFSVPTLYAAMLQEPDSYDLSSVRVAVSAAEPLPAGIFRQWKQRFGVEILDGIGSTEALHIYLSARAGKVRPGSTGQPVAGYDIRVVDFEGRDVSPGTIGDLLVRGESVARCYWNRPELSAQRMRDGWFHSGDKYSVDEDGYFWYAGRGDDMLRVSGQWVSPVEVESALAEHRAVLEAAVVSHRGAGGLYTVKAFVVLKPGLAQAPGLAEELQAFVKQRITPYKYPRLIEFIAELPKSATGKLLRYKLRESESRPMHADSVG